MCLQNLIRQEQLDPSLICGSFVASVILHLLLLLRQNKLLKEMERPCGSPWSQAIQLW
jgi:hypothetical protein